jgi:exopolyphosphatase / guanosine-5'-triphosphate,3'-diphosphate pyrophosphatase
MFHYFSMKKGILLLPAILYICCLSACIHVAQPPENKCIAYRAAFDVGSETTKMKVARVDKCLQKNEGIVYSNEIKVPYAENHQSGAFSPQIRNSGIIALTRLKNEAINSRAEAFSGVATESFRQVFDSLEFLRTVKERTGISITLIDQNQEAVLGYLAASGAMPGRSLNVIVWDIGGASMQMILRKKNKEFIIYRGKMAAVSFKEKILIQIKQQIPGKHSSPNPIGIENLQKAIVIASLAAEDVPEEIKKVISEPDSVLLGIGGVHNESIKKQLNSAAGYTQKDLMKALNTRIGLADKDIGGHYADTEISNLILVLGFMKKLGIKEVLPVNVNLADGVLIDPVYW